VADPPQGDQMSVEVAIIGAVVLATLVGWLQTKIEVRADGSMWCWGPECFWLCR
jgi:hypothetical protein